MLELEMYVLVNHVTVVLWRSNRAKLQKTLQLTLRDLTLKLISLIPSKSALS